MTIGEKIYQCRKKQNLTQESLAEKLSVSRQSVSKWETGDALPEITKLKPLSEIFGVSVEWLLSETDETAPEQEAGAYTKGQDTKAKFSPEKYLWLLGLALCIFGFVRLVMSIPGLVITFISGVNISSSPVPILVLILNVLVNVVMIIAGAVLAKKLKQKNE